MDCLLKMDGWATGIPYGNWNLGDITVRWFVGNSNLNQSVLATQYVLVPVSATKNGAAYNPTADTVQFAFMSNPVQQPGVSDWVSGSWETVATNVLYPYNARCLVGPTGSTVLTLGTYVMYVKITDSPEIPVETAGQLTIV